MAADMGKRGAGRNRWSLAVWGFAVLLLLIPAVAMQFDTGVDWSAGDFIAMGVMLAVACGLYEVLARLGDSTWYRAGAGVAIVTGFVTVWVNLAVGMLGSEGNPDNLLFLGVLFVAALGALLSRFRAPGMARSMHAAALAQAAITVYALLGGYVEVVFHVGFFILPWLVSAQLFGRAAHAAGPPGSDA